ncbi:thiol reductant ABC exporter subunit CydD, partial [Paraburkholderia sp. EG304]
VSVAMVALYLGLSYLGLMSLHAQVPTLGVGMFCLLLAPEFYAPLRRLAAHYHDRANALAAAAEVERLLGELPAAAAAAAGVDDAPPATARAPELLELHAPPVVVRDVSLRPLGAHHDVVPHLWCLGEAGQRVA